MNRSEIQSPPKTGTKSAPRKSPEEPSGVSLPEGIDLDTMPIDDLLFFKSALRSADWAICGALRDADDLFTPELESALVLVSELFNWWIGAIGKEVRGRPIKHHADALQRLRYDLSAVSVDIEDGSLSMLNYLERVAILRSKETGSP